MLAGTSLLQLSAGGQSTAPQQRWGEVPHPSAAAAAAAARQRGPLLQRTVGRGKARAAHVQRAAEAGSSGSWQRQTLALDVDGNAVC